MALLRDLITIPERVHQGDFVLKLSEGVSHAEQTLRDYVVTPQLADAFNNAMGFIEQAVRSGSSKAAYLHGSFGSGKSHFMAVLNLLLSGNTQARAIPELASVVARHDWTEGRRFLLVPYHMIGARDMESAILGQYADYVRKQHPDAPVPGFYLAGGLFRDAQRMRETMGDADFFAKLNAGSQGPGGGGSGGGGWGELDSGWDARSFEAAMLEAPNGEERARLVGDLISQIFSSYRTLATGGESFVPLDDGLAIMSRHARDLGYDAVILFLDELVLWLASHAADVNFVSREGTKLVKLVEATNADRPAPLVSFVARQRDLRDLVGENLAGAMQITFSDVLKHWEARFHRVTLEDRNLPAIAEKRVLRPRDETARQTLQAAFEEVLKLRRDVLDTLLTTDADREMFRKVYPFSPALVQTLIAVSAALQRERTALKLMMQLLVDRRDDLELGQLIPVGDLWDAIADGDEPFSEGMRLHFDNAKRLYTQRLLPMLETRHGLTWEAIRLRQADPAQARALRNDARLLKTLLLAALVPEVESLKGLTASRLVALNHGTFRSPIPGREVQDVVRRLRDWAGEVGEIKVSDDNNPLVSIQVTGVDLEPILRAAEVNDNDGNRRRKIRDMLFEQLGISDDGSLFTRYAFQWRGTRREVELLYENVREMSDERLRGRSGGWTVVLDFPFDEANRSPNDDIARLNDYAGGSARTLVWLPAFLSPKALHDLGRLVILDHILQGERFDQYAVHLSLVERTQARALARNQLDSLRIKLRTQLEVAYGVATEPSDAVMMALAPDQQFRSLDPTFVPRPPVGADFRAAFVDMLDQLLAHQYPAHPEFEIEIRLPTVKKVWAEVQAAIEARDRRNLVSDVSTRKLVRALVVPCRLGKTSETHVLIEPTWATHFGQCQARAGGGAVTVARLREWIDIPQPMGLPLELQNLIILSFAAMSNRSFVLGGVPQEVSLERLADELELREQSLPDADDWDAAVRRAGALFGLTLPQTLSAASVMRLVSEVRERVRSRRARVGDLVAELGARLNHHEAAGSAPRLRSAQSAQALLEALAQAGDDKFVSVLASRPLDTSETAVGRVLGQVEALVATLGSIKWDIFEAVGGLRDHRREAAGRLIESLKEALREDEHVIPLKARLETLERDGVRLLAATGEPSRPAPHGGGDGHEGERRAPGQPDEVAIDPPPVAPPPVRVTVVEERSRSDMPADQAADLLDTLKSRLQADPELELTLSWRLQRRSE